MDTFIVNELIFCLASGRRRLNFPFFGKVLIQSSLTPSGFDIHTTKLGRDRDLTAVLIDATKKAKLSARAREFFVTHFLRLLCTRIKRLRLVSTRFNGVVLNHVAWRNIRHFLVTQTAVVIPAGLTGVTIFEAVLRCCGHSHSELSALSKQIVHKPVMKRKYVFAPLEKRPTGRAIKAWKGNICKRFKTRP